MMRCFLRLLAALLGIRLAYAQKLPTVTVNGKAYRFLNGIGYGIDGYCCQVGEVTGRKCAKRPQSAPAEFAAR